MGTQRNSLGELEYKILLAIIALGGESHGAAIFEHLESAGRSSALGAIYASLDRLKGKGMVDTRTEEPSEDGGRARRLFKVLAEGIEAVQEERRISEALVLRANLGGAK